MFEGALTGEGLSEIYTHDLDGTDGDGDYDLGSDDDESEYCHGSQFENDSEDEHDHDHEGDDDDEKTDKIEDETPTFEHAEEAREKIMLILFKGRVELA